jgi:hypothetical protein
MSLLKPRNRRQRQRPHNTNEGRKKLGTPDNRRSAWPEELDPLIRLIQVFLGGDVVFVGAGVGEGGEMGEVEFCGEMDVGFVEPGGDEEEGEDLVDFYEEDLGFLVVFYFLFRLVSCILSPLSSRSTFGVKAYRRILHPRQSSEKGSYTIGRSSR